ncbi:hypothetical protein Tco_0898367, partial [Tanacetum coccineum]
TTSNVITFTLSCSSKPLSFDLGDFSTIFGLNYSENNEALPTKQTMKAALATLGLTDGNNPQFTPSELINKSMLRIKYFAPIWGVLMLHIVKCLGEVNAHRAADKSLSGTAVQSSTQSKAPTNKKLRKKKIPSSSEPKTSTYVRHPKQKKPVAETQHAEESWATADIIESLDASKPAKEVRSQPETLLSKRFLTPDVDHEYSRLCKDLQHPAHESHTLRVLELHSAFGRTRDPSLHYKLTFSTIHLMQESENLKGDEHMEDDLMVTHTGIISLGFYDLDQIMQDDESDLESMPYDEIISISGDDDEVEDSDKEISPADEVDANKVIDEILTEINIEDLTQIIFAAPITKVSSVSDSKSTHMFQMVDVQELAAGALWKRRTFLVKNKQIPFGHLPRRMDFLVAHVHNLGKYVPDKFADKIDSVVPRMIIKALEERMPQNVRVKMGEVIGLFRRTAKHQMQLISYLEQVLHPTVKVPDDILVVNAKNLTSKVNKTLADMNELVEHTEELAFKKFRVMIDIPTHVLLNFKKPIVFDNILFKQFLASLFGIGPSQYTPTPPPSKLDKGKETKKLADLKAAKDKSEEKLEGMISLLLQSSLTRLKMLGSIEWLELHKIAYRKQGAANDQLLKNLKAKFKWVAKDVIVDDMHRNLTLPQGITSVRAGQVIKEPEARILVHNGNFDLIFQHRSEYNLASTTQLIRIQNLIKIDSEFAQEIYDELIWVIECRPDVVEASKTIEKNLDGLWMD